MWMPRPKSWQKRKTTTCDGLCISFRKKLQAHRDPSFLLEPVRPAGTDTFLLCQTLFWAGFLLLGISLPWLWKAKSRLFVDREWQKASYMTGGGGGFVNEKHTCIGVKKKKHVGNFHTRIILTLFYFSDNCKWGVRLILQQQIFPMTSTELD